MYFYETHLHTRQGSGCGHARGRDYIQLYKGLGYAGLFVTDHFYGGNTAINRKLPWAEFVRRFAEGYEDALAEGKRQGVDVFFGWEEHFEDDEFLIYGLDADWLAAHPEIRHWQRAEYLRRVREAGALAVQAHPFRSRHYMRTIRLCGTMVDAIEAANAANAPGENALAFRYAGELGLPVTAGNDMHRADKSTPPRFAMGFEERLTCAGDYRERVLSGAYSLRVPEEERDMPAGMRVTAPIVVYDIEGNVSKGIYDLQNKTKDRGRF